MSPFLFLLVAKVISMLIIEAKREGAIKGIRVLATLFISHIFFVHDIFLFGQVSLRELNNFKLLLDTYCGTKGMEVSVNKSCMLFNKLGADLER